MILDTIILLEDNFVKKNKKPPEILKINYSNYCALIKEIENDYYLNSFHGMKIEIIKDNKIVLA